MKFAMVFSIVLTLSTIFFNVDDTSPSSILISSDIYNQIASSSRPVILGPVLFAELQEVNVPVYFKKSVKALNAVITPIEIVEDTRSSCHQGTECVQSGNISVKIKISSSLGESIQTIEKGREVITEGETIKLLEVIPTKAYNEEVKPEDYVFVFRVSKR